MSKLLNFLFLLVPLLKYSYILLIIIPLREVKCGSEVHYFMKSTGGQGQRILGLNFNKIPSQVNINGADKGSGKEFDLSTDNEIIIKFNEDIDSCDKMFEQIWGISEVIIKRFINLKPKSMANMFQSTSDFGNNPLKKVVFQDIDTSSVTDMSNFFEYCKNLEEVDLSKFNTASVKNMNSFFSNCLNLKKVNLSNFNTASVTDMGSFFLSCENLEEVDISSFNTASVTDMSHFFEYCKKLKEIDLSNFNTASVTTMDSMFRHCETLKVIDARSFDTSQGILCLGIVRL